MSRYEPSPRAGSYAPLLIATLALVIVLFFWTATRPPSPAEWGLKARDALLRGMPLPVSPSGLLVRPFDGQSRIHLSSSPSVPAATALPTNLISAKINRSGLGLFNDDLVRVSRIIFPESPASCSLRWNASPSWALRLTGSTPIILPWAISGSEPLMLPSSATEILTFIASAGGSWSSPDPLTPASRLVDRLRIRTFPPRFLTPTTPQEAATLMGPLFQAGKLRATEAVRLPAGLLCLPTDSALLPPALGLTFEGIRLAAPPEVSWDPEFRQSAAGIATLGFLSDLWERRAQTLATWLPALSDEVGPLLGSGFLRFNRPDLLPASATILTPMDEITLLRAIHAARADTTPVAWYPRIASPTAAASDPFALLQLLARKFSTPQELLTFLQSHGTDPFDHLLLLESGDLTLTEIPGAGFRLIACGSGSITLKGPCTANTALIISRGGTIAVGIGATRIPALIAIPDHEGKGGKIRFDHPAILTEPVSADTLELSQESGVVLIQPESPPSSQPLGLLIPAN